MWGIQVKPEAEVLCSEGATFVLRACGWSPWAVNTMWGLLWIGMMHIKSQSFLRPLGEKQPFPFSLQILRFLCLLGKPPEMECVVRVD